MNLNVTELEQIPENDMFEEPQTKTVKKVSFIEEQTNKSKKMNIERPQANRPQISYDDILSKMGMYVSDGKLHLVDRESTKPVQQQQQPVQQQPVQKQPNIQHPSPRYAQSQNYKMPPNQSNYIYSKYFKNEIKEEPEIKKPKTLAEYKHMLVMARLEQERIRQIKSKKLIIPSSNIQFSNGRPSDLNKLFNFSKK